MDPHTIETEFRGFARRGGADLGRDPPSAGVGAMLRFYAERRADGCDAERGGDMLLFQWGTHDWGEGAWFEFDIVRQVILPDEEDDDAIRQLHLTYRFRPCDETTRLGSGNRWCGSLRDLDAFQAFVRSTAAFATVAGRHADDVRVEFECAG